MLRPTYHSVGVAVFAIAPAAEQGYESGGPADRRRGLGAPLTRGGPMVRSGYREMDSAGLQSSHRWQGRHLPVEGQCFRDRSGVVFGYQPVNESRPACFLQGEQDRLAVERGYQS